MNITFPEYAGTRCLMMPYTQGDPESVPGEYAAYRPILADLFLQEGEIGYLTIDESTVKANTPHRGKRAKFGRALHTEAGIDCNWGNGWGRPLYGWGRPYGWGHSHTVTLDRDVQILLANSVDGSCAVWDAEHVDTSLDGDIGDQAHLYPYSAAHFMKAGEVRQIGILTPHESIPVETTVDRQFLRIVGAGVHGREPYFTENPRMR